MGVSKQVARVSRVFLPLLVVMLAAACVPPPEDGGGATTTTTTAPGSSTTITVGDETVSFAGPAGSTVAVEVADLGELPEVPPEVDLPLGAFHVDVGGITAGAVAVVTVQLETPVESVRKLIAGTWDTFEWDGDTGATVSADGLTITLHLRDGGRGDSDGVANGHIVDPFGPSMGWMNRCYGGSYVDVYGVTQRSNDIAIRPGPNVRHNMYMFATMGIGASTDGTCTGTPHNIGELLPPGMNTVVRGPTYLHAEFQCSLLGMYTHPVWAPMVKDLMQERYSHALPDDAWFCNSVPISA